MSDQNLRAHFAMEFYKLAALAPGGEERSRDSVIEWAMTSADLLLAELERTAKPEDDRQASLQSYIKWEDEIMAAAKAAGWTVLSGPVQEWITALAARAKAAEAEVAVWFKRSQEHASEAERMAAEVERLKGELDLKGNGPKEPNYQETRAQADLLRDRRDGAMSEGRSITITITDDEFKTLVTALNEYGHFTAQHAAELCTVEAGKRFGMMRATEGAAAASRCSKRAFAIQAKVQGAWEEKP